MKHTESDLQQQVVAWFRWQYPGVIIASFPNGGYRANAREVQRLKREGLTPGMPDLVVMRPNKKYHALCIEMKAPGKRATVDQLEKHATLELCGYCVRVIDKFERFQCVVKDYFKNKL